MATLAGAPAPTVQSERAFFFFMALAVSANAVAGFAFAKLVDISSFDAPWWVHVHAVSMMAWLGLFVTQNGLVWRGKVDLHRKLGVLTAGWAMWIVPLGLATTAMNVNMHRAPPVGTPAHFLAADWLQILAFGALVFAGVRLRHRIDWHRRLMLGATIVLIGPGIARLLPVPLLRENTGWVVMSIQLAYFAIGLAHDRLTRGRLHPAWLWGGSVLIIINFLFAPLAELPSFRALADTIGG